MSIVNIPAAPWPTTLGFQFSVFRTLGVQLKWSDIETCDGGGDPSNPCYTWTAFDQRRFTRKKTMTITEKPPSPNQVTHMNTWSRVVRW